MIRTTFGNFSIPPKLSLIVSVYNKIDFFKLVLTSIQLQTFKDFEVLIADDGSNPKVVDELQNLLRASGLVSQHIWHEDAGWRKNEIFNHSISAARGEYLVFIDGDCVLHPQFLADHWQHRQPGHSLAGRRLDLSPRITQKLTPEKIRQGFLQKNLWWIIAAISWRKDNNGAKGLRLAKPWMQRLFNRKKRGIVGCNFSLFNSDLKKVNGFDQRYQGPGIGEDSDLEFRLNLAGIQTLPFCHLGIQYHLYHPLLTRKNDNEALFEKVRSEKKALTEFGLKQR